MRATHGLCEGLFMKGTGCEPQRVGLPESDVQGRVACLLCMPRRWMALAKQLCMCSPNATVKAGTCHGMAVTAMFACHQCNGVAWRARAMLVQGAKLCGVAHTPIFLRQFSHDFHGQSGPRKAHATS